MDIAREIGGYSNHPDDACARAANAIWLLRHEITRLTQDLKQARDRVAKLESRLEIDHVWVSQGDGPMERVEIPPEQRDQQTDGIECRDETIKLARAQIEELAKEVRDRAIDECAAVADRIARIYHEDPAERVAAEWVAGDIRALKEKQT
jgi:chromosome segregation ATPase